MLGAILLGQRRYSEAEYVLLRSETLWQRIVGSEHYESAVVRHNLAALYAARGENRLASIAYEQSLAGKRRSLGNGHPKVNVLARRVRQLAATGHPGNAGDQP